MGNILSDPAAIENMLSHAMDNIGEAHQLACNDPQVKAILSGKSHQKLSEVRLPNTVGRAIADNPQILAAYTAILGTRDDVTKHELQQRMFSPDALSAAFTRLAEFSFAAADAYAKTSQEAAHMVCDDSDLSAPIVGSVLGKLPTRR